MTIGEWHRYMINELGKVYQPGEAKSIARVVFEDVLQLNSVEFLLKSKQEIEPEVATQLEEMLKRLLQHEPVQYVTGVCEFYGLKFKVDKRVLIPRPETEELVKWVLDDVKDGLVLYSENPKILDIGTGSGCIVIALKKNLPNAIIDAMDISDGALTVARENAQMNNVDVNFFRGDILNITNKIHKDSYDMIVSNPPYIKKSEQHQMQPNVINYEPHQALFVDDDDALLFYKAISKFASTSLNAGGNLYLEINEALGKEMEQLLTESSFQDIIIRKDINGKERMMRYTASLNTFYK